MKIGWFFAYTLEVVVLLSLFLFICALDYGYAVSLSWKFCLGAMLFPFVCLLPEFLLGRQRKWAGGIFAGYCALVLALHFGAISPVKPFRQFQNDIQNGMGRHEVQKLLAERFPAGDGFRRPVGNFGTISPSENWDGIALAVIPNQALQYTLDPDDGDFNAESLVVYFKDDRVVGTTYSSD